MSTELRLRYVRLNPRFDRDETLQLLKSEVKQRSENVNEYPLPVPWLNSKEHQLEFFAIPGEFCLNLSPSFQSGRVYGMDVTSGAAVAALLFDLFDSGRSSAASDKRGGEVQPHDDGAPLRVLDLCCAPGLKLCMMADLVPPSSILVGVDISSQRISLCKNIVKKYHIDVTTSSSTSTSIANVYHGHSNAESKIPTRSTIRLYCTDGTTFGINNDSNDANVNHGLVFDSNAAREEFLSRGKRKRMNKSARAREKRRLLELQRREGDAHGDVTASNNNPLITDSYDAKEKFDKVMGSKAATGGRAQYEELVVGQCDKSDVDCKSTLSIPPFDRVLVDAECSTDGAMRHIEKRQSSLISRSPAWDNTNMNELIDLQKRLIESGFRLLKRGGIMIYSTCSLSSKQNEQVVLWLLKEHKDAFTISVSFSRHDKKSSKDLSFIDEGSIPGTVRFNPKVNELEDAHGQVGRLLPVSGFFLAKLGRL